MGRLTLVPIASAASGSQEGRMTSTTSRDRDAQGFTAWLHNAARDGGVVADLMEMITTAPGGRGRDFTPDELFDYLISVGATREAFDIVIPASQASGYAFRDGKSCPVNQDPEHQVRPFPLRATSVNDELVGAVG